MDLFEYKAMELFRDFGVPTPPCAVYGEGDDLEAAAAKAEWPVVVKAQVQIGGRGKAGGIKSASSPAELKEAARSILGMNIRGHVAKKVLVAKKISVAKEWYFSILLDRLKKKPVVLFSEYGGMDIEEAAKKDKNAIHSAEIDPVWGFKDYTLRYLLKDCDLPKETFEPFLDFAKKAYALFKAKDCLLLEINPLGLGADGKLVALDGKITVDDSALYRNPDLLAYRDELDEEPLIKTARKFNFLYIPCEAGGTVAVMSNGSGMIMSCIDLLSKAGLKTGSALDLGGGATAERIKEAVKILFETKGVTTLFISIFGGITRCDEVAAGVREGLAEVEGRRFVVARIEGTNKDKGLEILKGLGAAVLTVDSIPEGVKKLAEKGGAR